MDTQEIVENIEKFEEVSHVDTEEDDGSMFFHIHLMSYIRSKNALRRFKEKLSSEGPGLYNAGKYKKGEHYVLKGYTPIQDGT